MKFGQSIGRVSPPRDPISIVQLLDLDRLLRRQKMAYRKLLRDHLLLFEMREEALAILQTAHTREKVRRIHIKSTKHGHVIRHFAEGVNFATQVAINQLSGQP